MVIKRMFLSFMLLSMGTQSMTTQAAPSSENWWAYLLGGVGVGALAVHVGNQVCDAIALRKINREMFTGPQAHNNVFNWTPHAISQVPTHITTHINNGTRHSSQSEYHVSRITDLRADFNAVHQDAAADQIARARRDLQENTELTYEIAGNMFGASIDKVVGGCQNDAAFQDIESHAWIFHNTRADDLIRSRCPQGFWRTIVKCINWNFEDACILYWKLNRAKTWLNILKP